MMAQLFVLAVFFAWAAAVMGYGTALLACFRRGSLAVAVPAFARPALAGFMGFLLLTSVGTAANFYLPLNTVFSTAVLVTGLLLFVFLRSRIAEGLSAADGALAGLFLFGCSIFSLLDCRCNDTGNYHLQAIKWITEGAVPKGLANLHPLLGYNCSWFVVSALLEPNRALAGSVFFPANPLLLFFHGSAIVLAARGHRLRELPLSALFLLSTAIPLLRVPWGRFIFSPSPDLPVMLLTFFVLYLMIRGLEDRRLAGTSFGLQVALVAYALTVKLSAAALMAAPILFALATKPWRLSARKDRAHRLLPVILTVSAVLLPWTARGILLSGGLLYPSRLIHFPGLAWSVSASVSDRMVRVLQDYTRFWGDPVRMAGGRSWFLPWLGTFVKKEAVIILVAIAGAVLLWRSRKKKQAAAATGVLLLPLLAALAGVAFWFLGAPDPRLGYGYLYAAALLLVLAGLARSGSVSSLAAAFGRHRAARRAVLLILAAGAVFGAWTLFSPGLVSVVISRGLVTSFQATSRQMAVIRHYGLLMAIVSLGLLIAGFGERFRKLGCGRTSLLAGMILLAALGSVVIYRREIIERGTVPEAHVRMNLTREGDLIYSPLRGDFCWDAPLPCTPVFDPGLGLARDAAGHPLGFRFTGGQRRNSLTGTVPEG